MCAKKQNSEFSASDNNRHIHEYVCQLASDVRTASGPRGWVPLSFGIAVAATAILSSGNTPADADSTFGTIGLTQLQLVAPQLTGAGVAVGQVEASTSSSNINLFEPNSSNDPGAQFTYFDGSGNSSSSYNSADGSWHANYVASFFYGANGAGVSPGVSHVFVYQEGDYYFDIYKNYAPASTSSGSIPAVVNQSFVYSNETPSQITSLDQTWDNYAAEYNTLYVSAVGDGGSGFQTSTSPVSYINPPSDAYNGIAVAALGGATGIGPTWDGRSKPDITAPGAYTSYTAPIVSGVATLMEQAGRGTNLSGPVGLSASDSAIANGSATAYTTAATDIRTVKALLLNGAVKPTGWTNSYTVNSGTYSYNAVNANAITPLDPRYGAGVVNAYNSYENLAGGEHNFTSTTAQSIAALPSVTSAPTANFSGSFSQAASTTNPATITGWNLATIAASTTSNAVENYDFNLTGTSLNAWDLTATLTWNKDYNASGINHLMLFLLNSSGQRVASSTSMLDNVQQININPALGINSLAPGQYDLAVEMLGGVNAISTSDTYALAWNFVDPTSVPEPTALAIFALGLSLLAVPRKRASGVSIGQ